MQSETATEIFMVDSCSLLKADTTIDFILSSNVSVMNIFSTSGGFHI